MNTHLHQRLAKSLLLDIASGWRTLEPRFPSRRRIEQTWGISRPTVESALRFLAEKKILQRRPSGSHVLTSDARRRARRLIRQMKFPALPAAATDPNADHLSGALFPGQAMAFSRQTMHVPLVEHLVKSLLVELASGAYQPGERFLSRRNVEQMWRVSSASASNAMHALRRNGLLIPARKSAAQVAPRAVRNAQLILSQLSVPGLPSPETWQSRRNKLLGKPAAEGYRLAAILDEPMNWTKLVEVTPEWTVEDSRTKILNQWHLLSFLREANRRFCEVTFLHDDQSPDSWPTLLEAVDRGRFDGVAVFQRQKFFPRRPLLHDLKKRGIPVLTAMDDCEGEADASVEFNNAAAGYDAMRILLEQGHRNIFILLGNPWMPHHRAKYDAALACVRDRGLQGEVRVRHCAVTPAKRALRKVQTLLANPKDRPTAIFCTVVGHLNNISPALKQAGLRIPRDLSAIGIGSAYTHPKDFGPVDLLEKNLALLGKTAAEQLIDLVHGRPIERTTQLQMPYLRRGSVTAPRARRPKTRSPENKRA